MIGKQILNYEIVSLIGEGGMGNVYKAKHSKLDRVVAIKSILPQLVNNEDVKKRFLNEATSMSKLQHPNIVAMYDYHSDDEGLYLIMEYIEGKELDKYVRGLNKPLDEDLSIAFMEQILDAFSHAHDKGIVHRDIKPSNIIISNSGEIKILDFGIAKIIGEEAHQLTKTGTQIGTVYYMSPEQVLGKKVNHLSDIYSLGVTMYQLLTSVNPYKGMTTEYEIYDKIVKHDLPDAKKSNSKLSDHVISVMNKATSKQPEDRYQSCKEFKKALLSESTIEPSKVQAKKTSNKASKPVTSSKSEGNNKGMLIGAVIGLAAVAVLAFVFMSGGDSDNDQEDQEANENTTEIKKETKAKNVIVNPDYFQERSDIIMVPKNKMISVANYYDRVYYPYPNKSCEFNSLTFWGWSRDGNSIALSKPSSSCSDGFCDFYEDFIIVDITEDKVIEKISEYSGNDGRDEEYEMSYEEKFSDACANFTQLCLQNEVWAHNYFDAENKQLYEGLDFEWNGKYSIGMEGDSLFTYTTNQFGEPIKRRVTRIPDYHPNFVKIIGFFKSPFHKRIAIIVEENWPGGASGIETSYKVYGALLRNKDYRKVN